jgi:hypothetical protein
MSWLPLSFGFPAILWGLLALPVIWWLLRLTPPRPQLEVFPPLKILARVLKREETPHQSPWWLTLLRLLMAALIVLALAEPVFNPREELPANGSALALVVDNGWASAPDWERRVATAERLIGDAERNDIPIILAFTAERPNAEIGPFNAQEARDHLNAVKPRPIPTDRPGVFARVAGALTDLPGATMAFLTDGLSATGDGQAFAGLLAEQPANVVWITPDRLDLVGLTAADNAVDGFTITATRAPAGAAPRFMTAGALDDKGRRIGDASITFRPGETVATGEIVVPFELRNDFASISLDGEASAAAVRVLDDTEKRRRGTIPQTVRPQLVDWMDSGGTLVRFASSRLLTSGNDEELLPVPLRLGERSLGGALSWTTPQAVRDFPSSGPFATLPPPDDVTVNRQILAEPTPDLANRTWATLADGTPLVTGDKRGKGMVVLFHVAPQATWSNLPISGTFVEMLRRIVQLSRNQGASTASAASTTSSLAPYRVIAADGALMPPGAETKSLTVGGNAAPAVTLENPPGLYGTEEGLYAHNLLPADATFVPLERPSTSVPVHREQYAFDESRDLKGPLTAAAILLLLIDGIIVLWLKGVFPRRLRTRSGAATAAMIALVAMGALMATPPPALAQDIKAGDAEAVEAISVTRLAYVVTGDPAVDSISRAGLAGLTQFLIEKTALEPGAPAGVNLEQDELAFYPIIYWPIDPNAAMPTDQAIARIDQYMKEGGTILFDTRDQYVTTLDASTSPATMRLRQILGNLNVPPLEPVPDDHVLTKAFFILPEFPGRFNGSPLWVEASLDASNIDNRPVRTGDGVSPILITANDFAGAWAVDESASPLLPTIPADPMQRVYAYRAGVNIIMYMLTGNYKSDQVHVPDLLQRLGQ